MLYFEWEPESFTDSSVDQFSVRHEESINDFDGVIEQWREDEHQMKHLSNARANKVDKILIVDDQPFNVTVLTQILKTKFNINTSEVCAQAFNGQ